MRVSGWVKLVLLGQLIAALWYSFHMPLWERSDEMNHYRYAYFIARNNRLPTQDDMPVVPPGYEIFIQYNQPPLYYGLLAFWIKLADDDALLETVANPFPICNISHDYFYLHTRSEAFPWRGTALAVWLGRFMTIGLGLCATVLVSITGRWLTPEKQRTGIIAAAVFAWIPGILEFTTWLNNDAPLLCCGALVTLGIMRGRKQLDTVTGLMIGAGTLMAAMTKISGLAILPATVGLLLWRVPRRRWIIIGLVILVVGISLANFAQCGYPLCRLHRYTAHFSSIETFFHTLLQPALYQNALEHFAQTLILPTVGNTPPVRSGFLFVVGALMLGVLALRSRQGWLWLIFLSALLLVLGRVWWLQSDYFHVRYMAVGLPAFALLIAEGLSRLPRWMTAFLLGLLWLVLMLIPVVYYEPIYRVPSLTTELPADAKPIAPRLYGEQIQLEAFEFFPAEAPIRLRLYWRAAQPIEMPYFAMVTLYDEKLRSLDKCGIVAGHPSIPSMDWRTDAWMAQDFVFEPVSDVLPFGFAVDIHAIRADSYIVSTYDPHKILPVQQDNFIALN